MRTVFVLGAGSSLDFDRSGQLPVGSGLAAMIRQSLSNELLAGAGDVSEDSIQRVIGMTGGFSPEHSSAMRTIRDHIHTKDSIDDLVNEWSENSEITRIAKICIARQIMMGERHSLMGQTAIEGSGPAEILHRLSGSWLGQVHRRHRAAQGIRRRDLDEVFAEIAFITFNYDRTVEQYLALAYIALGGLTADEAYARARSVPVLHVYGSLGQIGRTNAMPYGGYANGLIHAWQGIKTYTEEVGTTHATRIAKIIAKAEKLVFLGFAYHPQNMRILFPDSRRSTGEAYCNVMGLSGRRRDEVSAHFTSPPQFFPVPCSEMISAATETLFD